MKQMSLRMPDETFAKLDERVGMVARERWVRELVERELASPTHMPVDNNNSEGEKR